MTPRPQYRPLPILLLAGTALLTAAASLPASTSRGAEQPLASTTPQLPLAFEPNVGQADPAVRFLARGPGYGAYLLRDGMVLALKGTGRREAMQVGRSGHSDSSNFGPATLRSTASNAFLRMRLVGIQDSPAPRAQGSGSPYAFRDTQSPARGRSPLPGVVNYFHGRDPRKWRTGVPTYARVEYPEVYPGVDLAYHSRDSELEYDFIVSPGARPDAICVRFEGADRVRLDGEDLVLDTPAGEVRHCAPVAYQEVDGVRKLVPVRYRLSTRGGVGPQASGVKSEPASGRAPSEPRETVNTPDLRHSPYHSNPSNLWTGSVGSAGPDSQFVPTNARVGALPTSHFPLRTSHFEVSFSVGDYDPRLALVIDPVVRTPNGRKFHFSRFIGGTGDDFGNAIAVDAKLSPYVAGETFSTAFYPDIHAASVPNPDSDAFVVKLSPDGETVLYTTFFGGSDHDSATGLALARTGHLCVAGTTRSPDFPVLRQSQDYQGGDDGFHLVIHKNGREILRSTFLGGSGDDRVLDLDVDPAGRFYLAGETDSPDFPQRRPRQEYAGGLDGFLAISAANRSQLAYASHFGGAGDDAIHGVDVGRGGVVYVCGRTASADFPVKAAMQGALRGSSDAFLSKFTAGAASLVYSTFLGDVGDEAALDVVEDFRRGTVLTGWTTSKKFPTYKPLQLALSGPRDAFLTRLNRTGKGIIHSTFLGGSNEDQGNRVVLDPYDNIYLTGTAASPDIPRLSPAQGIFGGVEDAFAYQIAAHGERMLMGTYMGGGASDQGRGIAVDRWGSLYLTGATNSGGYPNTLPNTAHLGGFDAYVTKISSGADTYVPPRL